jgi:CheY-like chemotaxis protein
VVNELSDLAGRSVLLVEDNDELGDGTAALLKENGCDVRRARSADEALRLLDAGPDVDVILSDIVMPGTMDGVALARIVRERWPRLPVVLISGYSSALAQAGDDFEVLRKPCPPDELMRALRRALGGTADILR